MKLRLRNYESKETLKIHVPSQCSFLQLQKTLSLSLRSPRPSPSSLRFSLNAEDLLHAPSPHASLRSLGVAPGDLIYFSPDSMVFSSTQELIEEETEPEVSPGTKSMDIDALAFSERFSETYFLRKVLKEELADADDFGSNHKVLAIAVHAVLLESGFVGFDPVSGLKIDRFDFPDDWSSPVSICYCLPELLNNDDNSGSNLTDYVVLKFQKLGHFVQVYGCLVKGCSGLYKLSLNEVRFAATLDLVWARSEKNDNTKGYKDKSFNSYVETEVLEFWKIVKDGLVLPLLIDHSYSTGLSLPACLMRLPTELKLKILELLPVSDIARMGCVCSEMKYVASNNDLWKEKFVEEFRCCKGETGNWKMLFRKYWEQRKQRIPPVPFSWWKRYSDVHMPFVNPIRRDPNLFRVPPIIGGDYDHLPGFGFGPPSI